MVSRFSPTDVCRHSSVRYPTSTKTSRPLQKCHRSNLHYRYNYYYDYDQEHETLQALDSKFDSVRKDIAIQQQQFFAKISAAFPQLQLDSAPTQSTNASYLHDDERYEDHRQKNRHRLLTQRQQDCAAITRRRHILHQSATTIQAFFRGQASSFKFWADVEKQDEAATVVQSSFRGFWTHRHHILENTAATAIQAFFCGRTASYSFWDAIDDQDEAATTIQALFRGHNLRLSCRPNPQSLPNQVPHCEVSPARQQLSPSGMTARIRRGHGVSRSVPTPRIARPQPTSDDLAPDPRHVHAHQQSFLLPVSTTATVPVSSRPVLQTPAGAPYCTTPHSDQAAPPHLASAKILIEQTAATNVNFPVEATVVTSTNPDLEPNFFQFVVHSRVCLDGLQLDSDPSFCEVRSVGSSPTQVLPSNLAPDLTNSYLPSYNPPVLFNPWNHIISRMHAPCIIFKRTHLRVVTNSHHFAISDPACKMFPSYDLPPAPISTRFNLTPCQVLPSSKILSADLAPTPICQSTLSAIYLPTHSTVVSVVSSDTSQVIHPSIISATVTVPIANP